MAFSFDVYSSHPPYHLVYHTGGIVMKWMNLFALLLGLFVIYIIIELVRKLLGGSLGFEELVIGLLTTNLAYTFGLHSKLSSLNAKFAEHIGWHKGKGH